MPAGTQLCGVHSSSVAGFIAAGIVDAVTPLISCHARLFKEDIRLGAMALVRSRGSAKGPHCHLGGRIDQPIVRCFGRIDESDSCQFKAILQVLGEQMTNAGPLACQPASHTPIFMVCIFV